jgi:hypothetical protein
LDLRRKDIIWQRNAAATAIQAHQRGKVARKEAYGRLRQKQGAIKIQNLHRRRSTSKLLQGSLEEKAAFMGSFTPAKKQETQEQKEAKAHRALIQRAIADEHLQPELSRWVHSATIFDEIGLLKEIQFAEYAFFHHRLVHAFNERNRAQGMTEDELISEEEEEIALAEDWGRDSKGDGGVRHADFKYSVVESVASLCPTTRIYTAGKEFAACMQALHPVVFGEERSVVIDEFLVNRYQGFAVKQAFLNYANRIYVPGLWAPNGPFGVRWSCPLVMSVGYVRLCAPNGTLLCWSLSHAIFDASKLTSNVQCML